jgi:hypothetical protein
MERKETDIRRLKKRVQRVESDQAALTGPEFLTLLDVDEQHPYIDLKNMQRSRAANDSSDVDAIVTIAQGQFYQDWVIEDESTAIFIGGGSPILNGRRGSPTSLLSIDTIKTQEASSRASVIYFFCGEHTSDYDILGGPHGMLRSLVCQLLRQCPFKLTFLTPWLRAQLESPATQFRALCVCFRHLINQLADGNAVFCVIDGITFLEKKGWLEDTRKAIDELFDFVQDEETIPMLKLLITSPVRSPLVESIFPPENCLNLDGERQPRQFSERDAAMASARPRTRPTRLRAELKKVEQQRNLNYESSDWAADGTNGEDGGDTDA